jgi:hypothetical protein
MGIVGWLSGGGVGAGREEGVVGQGFMEVEMFQILKQNSRATKAMVHWACPAQKRHAIEDADNLCTLHKAKLHYASTECTQPSGRDHVEPVATSVMRAWLGAVQKTFDCAV